MNNKTIEEISGCASNTLAAQMSHAGSILDEKVQDDNMDNKRMIIDVPDGGYGWVVVFGVFLFQISTWASNSGFAIYLAYYLENGQFEGAQSVDYSAIGGIAFGAGLIFTPAILYLKEITNVRIVLSLGGISQFLGIFLAAFSTRLWQLYLTQGLLIGFGLALIFTPATIFVPQWFREKRSMAQSLCSSGSGVGGVMFNLSIQSIIKNINLRWALIIQAIICTVCTAVGVILVRSRDNHVKSSFKVWDRDIFMSFAFLLVSLFAIFTLLGYVILLYNLADFTRSLGYSDSQGSVVSCMVSVGVCFGRPIFGRLCDRFGPVTSNMVAHILVGIFCFSIWIPARNYSTAIGLAIVQGSLMGSIWVSCAPILTRLFGLRNLASVSGLFFSVIGFIGIVSPIIGIELRSDPPSLKSYSPTQYRNPAIFCGVAYLASAFILWVIRSYLISRDEIAERENSHEDNNELHISVSFKCILSNLLARSKTRKV